MLRVAFVDVQQGDGTVTIVFSGDESARTEYIHPRATIMGALGRHARVEEPLVFVTELVAFFAEVGEVTPEAHQMTDGVAVVRDGAAVTLKKQPAPLFAFKRQKTPIPRELAAVDELWAHCKSCYYAETCRGGCSWTAHTTLGRRGNNPFCYHRVVQLPAQGAP